MSNIDCMLIGFGFIALTGLITKLIARACAKKSRHYLDTEDLTMDKKLIVKTEMLESTHPVTVQGRRDLLDAYNVIKDKRDNGETVDLTDVDDLLYYTAKLLINITSIKKS